MVAYFLIYYNWRWDYALWIIYKFIHFLHILLIIHHFLLIFYNHNFSHIHNQNKKKSRYCSKQWTWLTFYLILNCKQPSFYGYLYYLLLLYHKFTFCKVFFMIFILLLLIFLLCLLQLMNLPIHLYHHLRSFQIGIYLHQFCGLLFFLVDSYMFLFFHFYLRFQLEIF